MGKWHPSKRIPLRKVSIVPAPKEVCTSRWMFKAIDIQLRRSIWPAMKELLRPDPLFDAICKNTKR